jgi:hypothetical protein
MTSPVIDTLAPAAQHGTRRRLARPCGARAGARGRDPEARASGGQPGALPGRGRRLPERAGRASAQWRRRSKGFGWSSRTASRRRTRLRRFTPPGFGRSSTGWLSSSGRIRSAPRRRWPSIWTGTIAPRPLPRRPSSRHNALQRFWCPVQESARMRCEPRGQSFEPRQPDQRFCSARCRSRGRRESTRTFGPA